MARAERFRRLDLARRTIPFTRTSWCLHSFRKGEVAVVQSACGRCGYQGFIRCGSRWSCPVCAERAASADFRRSLRVFQSAIDAGHCLFRVTFTVRHEQGMALDRLLASMRKAQQLLHSGRWWQDFKAHWSLGERSYGAEIMYGAHGWHPHRHSVYEGLQPPTLRTVAQRKAYAAAFGSAIEARWLELLAKVDLELVGLVGIAVQCSVVSPDSDDAEGTARYLTKGAMETTYRVRKFGRKGNLSPWQVLDAGHDQARSPQERAFFRARFREYAAATHGLHGVWMSRGWSRMAPELTEGELTADDKGVPVLPVPDPYVRILRFLKLQCELLERVEQQGPELAKEWLYSLRHDRSAGGLYLRRFSREFDQSESCGSSLEGRLMDWEWGSGPAPGPVPARRHGRARAAPPPEDEVDDF